jgi:hypothetical protein
MVVVSPGENHVEEDPAEEIITLSWLKNAIRSEISWLARRTQEGCSY